MRCLALLSEGPGYGLRLQSEFGSRVRAKCGRSTSGRCTPRCSASSGDGLVESDDGGGEGGGSRKRYRITAVGAREARRLAAHAAWSRPSAARPVSRSRCSSPSRLPASTSTGPQAHRRQVIEGHAALRPGSGRPPARTSRGRTRRRRRASSGSRRSSAGSTRPTSALQAAAAARPVPPADPLSSNHDARRRSRDDMRTRTATGIQGLRLGPGARYALISVDLSVERDELVAVMGPSGSGKSTLLTIAGSLEDATSGEVLVDGIDLASISRSDRARLRRRSIGYVFQDFNLLSGAHRGRERDLAARTRRRHVEERARDGPGGHGAARRRRAREPLPRRALGRRAPTGRDRPGDRGRARPAARRRADRCARLRQRRGGHAPAARGHPARRRQVVVSHEAQLASWADRVVFLRDGHVVDQTAEPPGPESLLAAGDRR